MCTHLDGVMFIIHSLFRPLPLNTTSLYAPLQLNYISTPFYQNIFSCFFPLKTNDCQYICQVLVCAAWSRREGLGRPIFTETGEFATNMNSAHLNGLAVFIRCCCAHTGVGNHPLPILALSGFKKANFKLERDYE